VLVYLDGMCVLISAIAMSRRVTRRTNSENRCIYVVFVSIESVGGVPIGIAAFCCSTDDARLTSKSVRVRGINKIEFALGHLAEAVVRRMMHVFERFSLRGATTVEFWTEEVVAREGYARSYTWTYVSRTWISGRHFSTRAEWERRLRRENSVVLTLLG